MAVAESLRPGRRAPEPRSAPRVASALLALTFLFTAGCSRLGLERPDDRRPTAAATSGDVSGSATDRAAASTPAGGRPVLAPARARAPTPDALTAKLRAPGPIRDLPDLAVRMGRTDGPVRLAVANVPAARKVGDRETFWVHDIQNEKYFQIEAVLRAVTDAAYFWVQDGQTVDEAGLTRGADEFSTKIIPAIRQVFGTEWSPGVDGDPHLNILQHEPIAGVAGYFSSTDEFTTDVEPYSNQREMFYINLGTYEPGSFDYLSLLAHEFQHMVHWRQDRGEAVWVNEGLSELATVIAGYQQQFGDAFLTDPDTPLGEWATSPGANAPHYAAAFLLFAYLRAQYGDEVIRAIVASPRVGAAGIEDGLAAVGEPRSFDALFLDWAVANLVDDAVRADGRYSYREMGIQRVTPHEEIPPDIALTVGQYATDYYDVTPQVADGRLHLDFEGDATVGLLDAVPDRPGQIWWSGRNDNADSRLTHAFDLGGVSSPALSFRMWHQLEENWDYAYVLVSPDGGATWERLPIAGTTDTNPNGNGYGRGLTGATNGWRDMTVDLSPYAGQEVLVRFEVVTDDAVSESGMALDDIRLNAVGYSDDAETDGGWIPEGWVRLDPNLPQRWGLQLVAEHPGGIDVHRFPVAEDGRADVTLYEIPEGASLTLAVSGLTPGTRHPAGYRLAPGSPEHATGGPIATAAP